MNYIRNFILLLIAINSVTTIMNHKENTEVQRALDWLMIQRLDDYGWGNGPDTAQSLITAELTNTGDYLERRLSAKQLEIELLLNLWHHDDPDSVPIDDDNRLTASNIAVYSLALITVCKDPRFIHGHDLIGSLLHHDSVSEYEFAISSLAACKSGAHLRKRHLRRLMDIANSKHSVDTLSKTILALQCVERDHRNRNVKTLLKKPLTTLTMMQEEDGGFGSLHATAVATQALQEGKAIWNQTKAVTWLLQHQGPNGAFFDVPTTAEVIRALANVEIANLKDCEDQQHVTHNEDVELTVITPYASGRLYNESNTTSSLETFFEKNISAQTVNEHHNDAITVTYSLWVGVNVSEKHTINITVDHNVTFYDVMQRASEMDHRYQFQATEWPNGHYVHTLYNFKEEPMSYHYWLLYRLSEFPDIKNPPGNQLIAPTGVDDLIVQDGEHYLFWYKKL